MEKLLIVCDCESEGFARAEAESLAGLSDEIAVYVTGLTGKRMPLVYPLMVRSEARNALKLLGGTADIVVGYGGRDVEAIVARIADSERIAMLRRTDISVEPSVEGIDRAERHRTSDHALTFVTADGSALTRQMMIAMAVARTGSEIIWRPLERVEFISELPVNLTVKPARSLAEAVNDGFVDWYIDFRLRPTGVTVDALKALSAGIPIAIVAGMESKIELPDECAVVFAPDVTKEEFVRGMLPFIDSDYRSEMMADAAYSTWSERWSPAVTVSPLVDTLESAIISHTA